MSIRLPFEFLKEDGETKKLNKLLTVTEEKRNSKKFGKGNKKFGGNAAPKTVQMFKLDEDKKWIYLPFRFVRSYFSDEKYQERYGQYLKRREYPKLFPDGKEGMFKGSLRPYQVPVYEEAVKYIKKERTVTLALYPSFGKTFMGALLTWKYNYWTLILVHRETIADAWVATFHEWTNIPKEQIIMVNDKAVRVPKKGSGKSPIENGRVFICMYKRAMKIPKKIRKKIGFLIIDEAHTFCTADKVESLLCVRPDKILIETATPDRSDGMETCMHLLGGSHCIEVTNEKPFKFYFIQTGIDFNPDPNKVWTDLLKLQMESDERNDIIYRIAKRHAHIKQMFIASRKEHCKMIKKELESEGHECAELYGTIKKCDTKQFLVGTSSKMGTGFDEKNACKNFKGAASQLVWLLHSFAEIEPWIQTVGRGMRHPKPKFIMLVDNTSITKRHIRESKKWVERFNGEVVNISVKKIDEFVIPDES